jgi:hypothetical protein
MATLSVTPSVDKWNYNTNVFTIVFKAYDDNGNRCYNNDLSIEYNITYDDTIPDLTKMQRVYSDASGLIPLVITKPCVISVYGICVHDINDSSKGEFIQEIAINHKINFQPIIKSISVIYIGSDIEIFEKVNNSDLLIEAEMSDGTVQTLSSNNCVIENNYITNTGPNIKNAIYTDPVTNSMWTLEFTVNGIAKLLSLEAYYNGNKMLTGDRILQKEINVFGVYLIGQDITEKKEIKDWYFIDIPIISSTNNGIIRLGYNNLETFVSIPYDKTTSLRLNVWYEGDKIEVGKTYNPNDIIIYLIHLDGKYERISHEQCQVDSLFISKEGLNWFTITYITKFKQIKQTFFVEGIINKKYIDKDFKVLYKNNNEDLTVFFKNEIEYDGVFLFDWTIFLNIVNKVQKYGLYDVTVPKLSGLSNQYDTNWEVLCTNKTTLKASIKKIYNEEDTNYGEESI